MMIWKDTKKVQIALFTGLRIFFVYNFVSFKHFMPFSLFAISLSSASSYYEEKLLRNEESKTAVCAKWFLDKLYTSTITAFITMFAYKNVDNVVHKYFSNTLITHVITNIIAYRCIAKFFLLMPILTSTALYPNNRKLNEKISEPIKKDMTFKNFVCNLLDVTTATLNGYVNILFMPLIRNIFTNKDFIFDDLLNPRNKTGRTITNAVLKNITMSLIEGKLLKQEDVRKLIIEHLLSPVLDTDIYKQFLSITINSMVIGTVITLIEYAINKQHPVDPSH